MHYQKGNKEPPLYWSRTHLVLVYKEIPSQKCPSGHKVKHSSFTFHQVASRPATYYKCSSWQKSDLVKRPSVTLNINSDLRTEKVSLLFVWFLLIWEFFRLTRLNMIQILSWSLMGLREKKTHSQNSKGQNQNTQRIKLNQQHVQLLALWQVTHWTSRLWLPSLINITHNSRCNSG